jgi:hypothetical protein
VRETEPVARRSLLERAAASVGERWAHAQLAELVRERRPAAGGWPGTISEARSRVRTFVGGVLARERLEPAAPAEIDHAARCAYARARAVWLASAKDDDAPEPDEDDEETTG